MMNIVNLISSCPECSERLIDGARVFLIVAEQIEVLVVRAMCSSGQSME